MYGGVRVSCLLVGGRETWVDIFPCCPGLFFFQSTKKSHPALFACLHAYTVGETAQSQDYAPSNDSRFY